MVSAYGKTLLRMLKSNITRLVALTAIITIGIAFIAGLGAVPPNMRNSADNYYKEQAIPDIIIKSLSPSGFSDDEIKTLIKRNFVEASLPFTSFDVENNGKVVRIYYLPLSDMPLNRIELLKGTLPKSQSEALAERASDLIEPPEAGSTVSLFGADVTISGITANPLLLSKLGEPSSIEDKNLDLIFYFDSEISPPPAGVVTDIYIKLKDSNSHNIFSKAYKDLVEEKIALLKASLPENTALFLSLSENKSAAMLDSYAGKIEVISYFFPTFFLLVALLTALATMTRFAEEERTVMGCYKTLGCGNGKIMFKYIFFSLICCVVGCTAGLILGGTTVMSVIFQAFNIMFNISSFEVGFHISLGVVAAGIMTLSVLAATAGVIIRLLKEKPAALLKQKAPKTGKKIFLERLPFLWKKLKFKYKSSLRNIFRYPRHFIMTVVSVAGSTALVLAGLALFNAANAESNGTDGMFKSLASISTIIIIFAALLNVLVIYNLTNMNISERKREIATLKVLGYKHGEVAGYIYREIFMLSLLGIITGLPSGYLFIDIVFSFVEFGSVTDIKWYSWVLTIALSVFFILTVDALLYKKIVRSDMLESLKINE